MPNYTYHGMYLAKGMVGWYTGASLPVISFWHTFCSKSHRTRYYLPPPFRLAFPPLGNPGSATDNKEFVFIFASITSDWPLRWIYFCSLQKTFWSRNTYFILHGPNLEKLKQSFMFRFTTQWRFSACGRYQAGETNRIISNDLGTRLP